MQQRPALRRIFLLISLTSLLLTTGWSTLIYRRESEHVGEPLPVMTLAQLAAQPTLFTSKARCPGSVRLWFKGMGATTRPACIPSPRFMTRPTHWNRVAALSLFRTFPGDVNEAHHPFDPRDPVIEGEIEPDGLYPDELQDLRTRGIPVDDVTVLFLRRAFHRRVPPADSVDVLIPWLVGLPVTLVTALVAFTSLRPRQQQV